MQYETVPCDPRSCPHGRSRDAFLFDFQPFGPATPDRVNDFTLGQDIIVIAVDAMTGVNFGNQADLLLKTANPVNGTTPAGTAQLIYETYTGNFYGDSNGAAQGGVTQIASLGHSQHHNGRRSSSVRRPQALRLRRARVAFGKISGLGDSAFRPI